MTRDAKRCLINGAVAYNASEKNCARPALLFFRPFFIRYRYWPSFSKFFSNFLLDLFLCFLVILINLLIFFSLSLLIFLVMPLSVLLGRASGHWTYRTFTPPKPHHEHIGTAIIAFTVWWIFYGIFTEPGHIFGHEPYPNVEEFTDEQLGIPPVDEE